MPNKRRGKMRVQRVKNVFRLRKLPTCNNKYMQNNLWLKDENLSATYELVVWYDHDDAKVLYDSCWKGDNLYYVALPSQLN